ncbi:uncharacterized protein A4U43_C03F4170 [Asparagus officinalis]|uniref:DNA-directed RNA polymerase RBP11-like dimerisation domain-containing protein n=1 Tax=Asparagus officinalis TaxID=4686 RepID=A0A5P1F7Y3_ASPOF|nr:uncharacterized protein A4U43_C03F4170 [Asparagus officinalis]
MSSKKIAAAEVAEGGVVDLVKGSRRRREEEEESRELHRDPNVLFAGYKLPHPLQYKILVRIHTTSQSSPSQAYRQGIEDLDKELQYLKKAFEV